MVVKKSFGQAITDEDVIEIQGEQYHLRPMGIKTIRHLLAMRSQAEDPEANLDASLEILKASIVVDEHERLMKHADESMGFGLITEVAMWLVQGQADVDPTLLQPSPDGSSPTGSNSTAGARRKASTPSS